MATPHNSKCRTAPTDFVTVAGKSASEATLKASAVNCAVLPYMLRSSVLSNCG